MSKQTREDFSTLRVLNETNVTKEYFNLKKQNTSLNTAQNSVVRYSAKFGLLAAKKRVKNWLFL